jgi:hypothetical protein
LTPAEHRVILVGVMAAELGRDHSLTPVSFDGRSGRIAR